MPSHTDQREAIIAALKAFEKRPLADAARDLFATLGYQSDRRLPIATTAQFLSQLDPQKKLTDRDRETLAPLQSLHLLFQLSDAELDTHGDLFDDKTAIHTTKIESYIFFAVDLPPGQYTRTALSTIVRAINKPLPMPALVLFRHGDSVSLGIIHRRLHKRDQSKDVLDKVTLVKDIACAGEDPIRAHVEILNDFVLANLDAEFNVANFVSLHEAWLKRLGSYALSNAFYREIADWYFWAHHQVDDGAIRLPQHCDTEQEKSLFLIRLLTRVIFSWFLVEKRLIPTDLFRERRLKALLKDFKSGAGLPACDTAPTYYRAILQNLFFGTLNMPPEQRAFRQKKREGERYDQNFGITNLWRYETAFRNPADWLEIAKRIPFLNGGLFDCLDDKTGKKKDNFILDGFSDREDFGCHLPNDLFFGPERTVDLSHDYGEEDKRTARSRKAKVRGLIEILSRYKFTVEENTPLEEEIALDPELLGKVFENLLASYNEDTRTTARKALGAFYTPREIVSYMVDEALKSYLKTSVTQASVAQTFLSAAPDDISRTHRDLPHWKTDGAIYWITFRMADSLPQEKLRAWREERDTWVRLHPEPWSEDNWEEYNKRFGEKLEAWLDSGMGSRALARPDVREAVKACLLKFDGQRLLLHAAVIMPNHVHALIEPLAGEDLSKLLQGIKGASAREANKLSGATGNTFWLDETYDHIVRSQRQYDHFVRYIAENPGKAHLPPEEYWLSGGKSGADIPVCAITETNRQTRMSAALSRIIEDLFSNKATLKEIKPDTRDALIAAIGRVKILDPACGSGAFPMGALHRLVDLLQKLDPNNESWKRDRLAEARRYSAMLEQAGAPKEELAACEARIADIAKSFDTRFHALDFARKLYLIENSIYGVDIQPIAVQIAKLRFFISLVVDQKGGAGIPACAVSGDAQTGMSAPPLPSLAPWNMGLRPLPNLETKFVAADTLIPLPKNEHQQGNLFEDATPEQYKKHDRLKQELTRVRHAHFGARDPRQKRQLREEDAAIRDQLRDLLQTVGLPAKAARAMATWDPYDQNTFAPFFDPEWMFGLPQGGTDIPVCAVGPSTQTGMSASHSRSHAGFFDIVIGNPPYIRIQTLKQKDPDIVAFYKEHYASAAKGNYDIYVVFIEAGLRLLKSDGHLAFICPHKFFNAQYGEALRNLVGKGKNLRHVVHFGDQQVFQGATIYTCLLFLARQGSTTCRFTQPTDLSDWLQTYKAPEANHPASLITAAPWNLNTGSSASIFAKLNAHPRRLVDVAARIYQGLVTGADPVFLLSNVRKGTYASTATGEEHELEAALMHPLCKGAVDIRRYFVGHLEKSILFPYHLVGRTAQLLTVTELEDQYPKAWRYLLRNRKQLQAREGGKWKNERWYAFGRSQNLSEMEQRKLLTPCIASSASFTLDDQSAYYFVGSGGGGGYGITLRADACLTLKVLLGILNSAPADYFLKRVSTPFANGYFAYNRQFIEQIPIPLVDEQRHPVITTIVEILLSLHHKGDNHPADQSTRDPLMLAYFERILNGLVYELYFPDEVHAAGLQLFDLVEASLKNVGQAFLPASSCAPSRTADKNVCATLDSFRTLFETLYDGAHPLRIALDKLQTLDTVRIIEGKA